MDFMIQENDTLRSFLIIPGASAGVVFERNGEIFVDMMLVGMGHIIDHFPEAWFHGFMRGLVMMGFRDVTFFKKWGDIEHADRDKMRIEVARIKKAMPEEGGGEDVEKKEGDAVDSPLPANVEELVH